jgi:hypothetical protein
MDFKRKRILRAPSRRVDTRLLSRWYIIYKITLTEQSSSWWQLSLWWRSVNWLCVFDQSIVGEWIHWHSTPKEEKDNIPSIELLATSLCHTHTYTRTHIHHHRHPCRLLLVRQGPNRPWCSQTVPSARILSLWDDKDRRFRYLLKAVWQYYKRYGIAEETVNRTVLAHGTLLTYLLTY